MKLAWSSLSANQIMAGSLAQILRALGVDLWCMLHESRPLAA
jgi:hypothetical protein